MKEIRRHVDLTHIRFFAVFRKFSKVKNKIAYKGNNNCPFYCVYKKLDSQALLWFSCIFWEFIHLIGLEMSMQDSN